KAHNRLKGMLIGLLKYMAEEADEDKIARVSAGIIKLFVECFDIFFFHAGDPEADKTDFLGLQKVNAYMHTHLREKVTIGDLARILNFTEGYMSEYMRKNSLGFREMMSYIRANESEHYLMNTDKTILEISEECGFSDVKYYYSAFRRWYKCTPKQFRDQYRRSAEEKIEYLKLEDIANVVDKLMTEHYMDTFFGITTENVK
ncbi:MAG: AraC family transcriptional regulator, partial [Clostridiales bacterium]|nr:AraC family transcriptional regulator [Clostridiales bacterium]